MAKGVGHALGLIILLRIKTSTDGLKEIITTGSKESTAFRNFNKYKIEDLLSCPRAFAFVTIRHVLRRRVSFGQDHVDSQLV